MMQTHFRFERSNFSKRAVPATLAAFALLLGACADTGGGTGALEAALVVSGTDEMTDSQAVPIAPARFFLSFEAVALERAGGEGGEEDDGHGHGAARIARAADSASVTGEPGVVDLLNDPDPLTGEVPLFSEPLVLLGEYIEARFSLAPGEVPLEAEPLTVLLEADVQCGGGASETLLVALDEDLDDLAVLEIDVDLEPGGEAEAEFALDVSALLAEVDVCAVWAEAGGVDGATIDLSREAAETAAAGGMDALHDTVVEALGHVEEALGAAFAAAGGHPHE